MSVPDPESLRRVLLDHHPVVRSETGPLAGCRCGQVQPGQDVIAHVAAQVVTAMPPSPAEEAVKRVEAVCERLTRLAVHHRQQCDATPRPHRFVAGHHNGIAVGYHAAVTDLRAALTAPAPHGEEGQR